MILIKKFLNAFIKFFTIRELTEEEKMNLVKSRSLHRNLTSTGSRINPASGLPMVGCVDLNGNTYGTSSSFANSYICTELHRPNMSSSFRSFDSFNTNY